MRCIDAHHHLWRYTTTEYGWIDDKMRALRRDFLPADLQAEISAAKVHATVAVQARQTLEETRWLLDLAREHPFIAGVVGWAPIASHEFPRVLEELCCDGRLKGLRHVLQDEPDEGYALHEGFQRGLKELARTSLVYDILIYARHLPMAVQLVDQHPNQVFVLDHLAKPKIAQQELSPWRESLWELAQRPNVVCKVSGMVTEADWQNWSLHDLIPYLETALECFGPQRLLAGSDWPVCTVAAGYQQWWQTLRQWTSALSATEQENIFGANAARIYRLKGQSV
ncbi:MAG: amidohydrolase family protein [Acidobacteria bacterium]|jgi:L-fuconolactonase|nr:amidohydrolase family protein [Acidobacteriota bacterium]